jgi:hypothetical protein
MQILDLQERRQNTLPTFLWKLFFFIRFSTLVSAAERAVNDGAQPHQTVSLTTGCQDKGHAMPATAQTAIALVGIDIGKNSFHIVGLDDRGAIVLRRRWSRNQVEARFANRPPCLIGRAMLSFRVSARTDLPAWLAGNGPSDRRSACGFGLGLPHWHYGNWSLNQSQESGVACPRNQAIVIVGIK